MIRFVILASVVCVVGCASGYQPAPVPDEARVSNPPPASSEDPSQPPAPAPPAGAPKIDSIEPPTAPVEGGSIITIRGTNLLGKGATVTFGDAGATVSPDSSNSALVVTTPAHAAGTVQLTVTTGAGTTTAATAFEFKPAAFTAAFDIIKYNDAKPYITSNAFFFAAIDRPPLPTFTAGCTRTFSSVSPLLAGTSLTSTGAQISLKGSGTTTFSLNWNATSKKYIDPVAPNYTAASSVTSGGTYALTSAGGDIPALNVPSALIIPQGVTVTSPAIASNPNTSRNSDVVVKWTAPNTPVDGVVILLNQNGAGTECYAAGSASTSMTIPSATLKTYAAGGIGVAVTFLRNQSFAMPDGSRGVALVRNFTTGGLTLQ